MSPAPIAKDGRLESEAVLNWARRQRCRMAEEGERVGENPGPCTGTVDPHHVDGKGMGGARCRDDRVVPLCRGHHDETHQVAKDTEAVRELMGYWADQTLRRFLERAEWAEVQGYVEDLKRFRERPLAVEW